MSDLKTASNQSFIPYIGISTGIHLVTVIVVAGWWGTAQVQHVSVSGAPAPITLMIMGDSLPTVNSGTTPQKQDHRALPLEESVSVVQTIRPAELPMPDHGIHDTSKIMADIPVEKKTSLVQTTVPRMNREIVKVEVSGAAPNLLSNPIGKSGQAKENTVAGMTDNYLSHIRQRIENFKRYPPIARRLGEEGGMLFKVVIDKTGKLVRVDLLSSEASERLITAGQHAIQNAAPFDRLPDGWTDGLTLRIPIRFTMPSFSDDSPHVK